METSTGEVKASYDEWHLRRAQTEQAGEQSFQPWHRTVISRLPDLNGLKVLEVGCGRGDFAIWLARKYPQAQITAVDFSDSAVAVAKERMSQAGAKVEFRQENAQSLTLPAGTFDLVFSCECLEHVPEPIEMAREMARVLKPGGHFILTTENYFNGQVLGWVMAWLRQRKFDSGSGTQPHENFFLFWRVKRTLENGGLKVEHMQSNHFQWLLLPRVSPSALCTEDFKSPFWRRVFRPFGRHFTFQGSKRAG
jgi:2-polyprenyl-3-methyl-5-hydroxy-6-metoxy-1,4-benzoquinol methylase